MRVKFLSLGSCILNNVSVRPGLTQAGKLDREIFSRTLYFQGLCRGNLRCSYMCCMSVARGNLII